MAVQIGKIQLAGHGTIEGGIIAEADDIIHGDRRDDYGGVDESFEQIAKLWTAMGLRKVPTTTGGPNVIERRDVALALLQLKVARSLKSPEHRDSYVDMVGYAALAGHLGLS